MCNGLQVSLDSQKCLPLVDTVAMHKAAQVQWRHYTSINPSCCVSLNTQPSSRFMRFLISWLQLEKVGQVSEAGETTTFRNTRTSNFWSVNFPPLPFFHKAYSFAYKCTKILCTIIKAIFPTDEEEREKAYGCYFLFKCQKIFRYYCCTDCFGKSLSDRNVWWFMTQEIFYTTKLTLFGLTTFKIILICSVQVAETVT